MNTLKLFIAAGWIAIHFSGNAWSAPVSENDVSAESRAELSRTPSPLGSQELKKFNIKVEPLGFLVVPLLNSMASRGQSSSDDGYSSSSYSTTSGLSGVYGIGLTPEMGIAPFATIGVPIYVTSLGTSSQTLTSGNVGISALYMTTTGVKADFYLSGRRFESSFVVSPAVLLSTHGLVGEEKSPSGVQVGKGSVDYFTIRPTLMVGWQTYSRSGFNFSIMAGASWINQISRATSNTGTASGSENVDSAPIENFFPSKGISPALNIAFGWAL